MAYVGTPIEVGNQFSSLVGKRFSGDASTTAFTLDVRANSALDIEVFVENVRQDPNSAYTVDGTTLTFTAAPPSGTNNIYVVHQAPTVASVSPTAGSVTASSFDNTVISGHTALATKPDATDEFLVSDAGTIKRVDYSLLTPISELDQFRLTAELNANADPISSNLERIDDATFSKIGTGMTLNSGIYTFPRTGVYQVSVNAEFQISQDTTADCETQVSSDSGSSFDQTAVAVGGMQGSNFNTNNSSSQCYVNVTNASTFRVKFVFSGVASTDTRLRGSSTRNFTTFTFIRLGDSQ
jgi:hypothetical protein